jgi:pimeloyl-ACP methyl ester carboxylesterase
MTGTQHPLHWVEAGPSDGAVLLLLHGFPFNSAMWRPQLETPPAGWRVIAPDLTGFGGSAATVAAGTAAAGSAATATGTAAAAAATLTMDRMADDVAALLDRLRIRGAAVCGLSMGGYVTFALLRRHAARVRALVLADTRAAPDSEDVRRGRLETAARVATEGNGPVVEAMLPKLFSPVTPQRQPDLVAEVRAMMADAPPAAVAAALRGMAARPDSTPMLRSINVPTRVVVGQSDQITPPGEAQLMARAIPGAMIEVIPDAGHLPNLENAAAFDSALTAFLRTLI